METDEASTSASSKNAAKFLCTPIGTMKKSFIKQKATLAKKHAITAGNTSIVYKQSLTSNNRQLARTLEKTKQDLADALNANISLAQENNLLASKVLAFRRLAELKNDEVEREVESRIQQRLHSISDLLGDVERSRANTTDLLAAAAQTCKVFNTKTLDNLFDESIQYCSKLPSRVATGVSRLRPVVSVCREQLDITHDDTEAQDFSNQDDVGHAFGNEVFTSASLPYGSPMLDNNNHLLANETVAVSSSPPLATAVSGAADALTRPQRTLLNHDDIPVGPVRTLNLLDEYEQRLSGSFHGSEQASTSDTVKIDGYMQNTGLYEVKLSPPKIFRKYMDPTGDGSKKNQCNNRQKTTVGLTTKSVVQLAYVPAAAKEGARDRRRSTFAIVPSQETEILPEPTGASIVDESDSILESATSDLDVILHGSERLPLAKLGESDMHTRADAEVDTKSKAGEMLVVPSDTSDSASGVIQKELPLAKSKAPNRQMDIYMAKPGELHFVVGSRDGTRQPNLSEMRPSQSTSRSKKRQTFIASSKKPPNDELQQGSSSGSTSSVFDFKGTPVAGACKDAFDTYELSLTESILTDLPRQQYQSEAAAAATAAAASGQSMSKNTKNSHEKVAGTSVPIPTPMAQVSSSCSEQPAIHTKSAKSTKSHGKSRQPLAKENEAVCEETSQSNSKKTEFVIPLAPMQVIQAQKIVTPRQVENNMQPKLPNATTASANHVTAMLPPIGTSLSSESHQVIQDDSFNVFSDSMIERYRKASDFAKGVPKSPPVPSQDGSRRSDVMSEQSEGTADDGGERKRRRCASSICYTEPQVGKKLRRGDPGTSSLYGADTIEKTKSRPKKSSLKHGMKLSTHSMNAKQNNNRNDSHPIA